MKERKSLLVNGNIPAGKGCPFMQECNLWSKEGSTCPTWAMPKVVEYSCAMARALDMIQQEGE